jgi:hypothetical protein
MLTPELQRKALWSLFWSSGLSVMQRAEIASVDALNQPPFTAIGDPETLFPPKVLRDMLDLTRQLAAA